LRKSDSDKVRECQSESKRHSERARKRGTGTCTHTQRDTIEPTEARERGGKHRRAEEGQVV